MHDRPIELTTLGEVRVTGLDASEGRTLRPMVLSLLVFLAAEGVGRVHRRERLVGLFWPDVSDRRARQSLRRHLHLLRKALGDDALVPQGREAVALDPGRVRCDAAELESAWKAGEHARCLQLYCGEFAPGLRGPGGHAFDDWLHGRREGLRRRTMAAAEVLTEEALAREAPADAVRYAQRAAELDPLNERAARRVMDLLHRAGDAGAALRRFDGLHRRMWEELGVGPSSETVELAAHIREETLAEAPSPGLAWSRTDASVLDHSVASAGDVPVAEVDSDRTARAEAARGGRARLWRAIGRSAAVGLAAWGILALWLVLDPLGPGSGRSVATAAGLESVHTGDDGSLEDLLRALDHYRRETEEHPGDPDAWAALARTGFTIGGAWPWRTDEVVRARMALKELERLAPDDGPTLWTRGLAALLDRRDYAEAASLLREAADALPAEPRIRMRLGEALLGLGRPGPAWEAFREAERAGGLTPDLAQSQGYALSLQERHEEARDRLARARLMAPRSSTIHHTAFRAALRAGDTVQLRRLTDGPLPKDGRLRAWGPGHAAYHRGDFRAADSLLSRDARIDHRQVGIVAHLLGDRERARAHGDSLRLRAVRALAAAEAADPEALDPAWLGHSHARLGVAFALLGAEAEARRHAGMARLLVPLDQEPQLGFPPLLMSLHTLMILGDTASAADLALPALERPTPLSRAHLEVDPLLRPILRALFER